MPPNDLSIIPAEVLSAEVKVPQDATIVAPAARLLAGVEDMIIDSDAVYEAAAHDLGAAKTMKKSIDEDRKTLTRPLDDLKAKIMDKYRPALELCDRVIAAIEPKMLTYQREQAAKAEAERKRLEDAARQERERLEREAADARRRAEAEAAAARAVAAEEAAKLAAEGKDREAEERRQAAEREAQDRLATGEIEATVLRETAAVTAAAPATTAAPVVPGTSVAQTFKARCIDKVKFIQFVAANPMYAELLDVNESGLNAQARSLKTNLRMDGIEVYPDQSIRSRSR